jgi:hypothetical protein
MFGVFMTSNASIGEDILSQIKGANLLTLCGGPYPDDPAVSRVESLDKALDIMIGTQLDAVPYSNWDRTLTAAFRESRGALKQRKGMLAGFFLGNPLRERERSIRELVEQRIEETKLSAKLKPAERISLASHLTELFEVASLILDVNRRAAWPLVIKATDFALQGYLPVDFAGEGQAQRVLVY